MFNSRGLLSFFFVALSFFIGFISASPVPPKGHAAAPASGHAVQCPANLKPRSNKIFLGYNGFNGTPRNPQASAGGELGAVFYIADAVDLAKAFAHGADPSKDYVCLVHADADAWSHQPKVWVPATAPRGNAMNAHYPGAVLFDHHTNAGLLAGSPAAVHQMGIRAAQIARVGVTVECYHKLCFADAHQTLNYESMKIHWDIQTP
ncbi:hypothetical protein BJ912DRAFT_314971 [Pholiota molesta]|nr:hypothetical protein BJ912DRAFT_314971 [Pholiota molesta]